VEATLPESLILAFVRALYPFRDPLTARFESSAGRPYWTVVRVSWASCADACHWCPSQRGSYCRPGRTNAWRKSGVSSNRVRICGRCEAAVRCRQATAQSSLGTCSALPPSRSPSKRQIALPRSRARHVDAHPILHSNEPLAEENASEPRLVKMYVVTGPVENCNRGLHVVV
jgi:hypothetical protein